MKYILFAFGLLFTFGCSHSNSQQSATITELSATEFKQMIDSASEVQLVDVRTAKEYQNGNIQNAVNIDFYQDDFKDQLAKKLDKSKPVFVYCKSGGRSGKTAKILSELGFDQIYDLDGGYQAWESTYR